MIREISMLIAYSITSIIIVFLDKKFKVTKRPQFYIILLNLGKNQDLSISKIIFLKIRKKPKNGIF